jgi:hypothetical protein
VTAGNPASIKAARTASTFSGLTTDLIIIMTLPPVPFFLSYLLEIGLAMAAARACLMALSEAIAQPTTQRVNSMPLIKFMSPSSAAYPARP